MKPAAKGGTQNQIGILDDTRQLGQLLTNFTPQDPKKGYHRLLGMHLGIVVEQVSKIAAQGLKATTVIFNPGPMLRWCGNKGLVSPAG